MYEVYCRLRYWLFGISDAKNHKCYLELVESRDQATLLPIIERCVPKTSNIKIVSDGWASYSSLADRGYQHSVVIHKEEFVNAQGEHTNSVESLWSQLECWIGPIFL